MARDIKAFRERLDAIAEDRRKFHLTERTIESTIVQREETHSFVQAESVIGRDGDKMRVIRLLLDGNVQENSNVQDNVSVVAIVGIGGLGKTTLAQLVYNNERVTKHFELKMWVCVSDDFDVKLIVKKIIESATSKKPEKDLRNEINGKKYLLVLDDVWNENREKWLRLRVLLQGASKGSKILITTRSELVANVTSPNSLYVLKGLSKEESWSLVKQMAFKHVAESKNTCRVTIGEEIVQKSKGVPLVIRVIGSLLHSKDTDNEWVAFKNNDLSKIIQKEDVFPILKLSYDHLPSNLKRCFAFCSLYVKDQNIDKHELIQMWIANGFIPLLHENQQLKDVGDLYFMDLLRRSLFQDVQRDEWGEIRCCKMHGLVHDLAQSVARFEYSTLNSDTENVTERTRHVLVAYRSWNISTQLVRGNKLRTLISKDQELEKKDFKKIVSTHKCLRLLDLPKMKIKTVPNYINKLKHLRYLDLSDNDIKYLPSSITKLQNLHTLKLNGCFRLKELPRDFKKLVNLNHVELDRCYGLIGMPGGLGQLRSLLTLTRFVADLNSGGLSELQNLNNLRGRLSIEMFGRPRGYSCSSSRWWYLKDATAAEGVTNYLEAKKYLKRLVLEFDWVEDNGVLLESLRPHPNLKELEIERYGGVSFRPSWMMVDKIGLFSSFLPNLVRIEMSECDRCKHLPLFGQLPSLQFLRLLRMESLEYMEDKSSSGSGSEDSLCSSSSSSGAAAPTPTFFPSLKTLKLILLPELKGWWRSQAEEEATTTLQDQQQQHLKKLPSFPSLSQLSIQDCPNLASMPILQPCLEQLDLCDVSKKVVEEELKMTLVSPTPPIDTLATSSSSSSLLFPPLSNLKSLELFSIDDLVTLPEESFLSLTSLQRLDIQACPKLISLPDGMR